MLQRAARTLVAASAFNKLSSANRAGALLASRGYQQQPAVSNRLLAVAGASRCVAQHFTTSTFASRAAMGDGAGGLLVDQMKLKVGANQRVFCFVALLI